MRTVLAFLTGVILMAGGGYLWSHRDWRVSTTVDGPTSGTKTEAVEEIVTGIRQLDRLVVFQAALVAVTDAVECQLFCTIKSSQTLITPGYVNYFIDMDRLRPDAITVAGRRVTVRLPSLGIERPNADMTHLRVFNRGVWSHITYADQRLEQKTRAMAMRQLVNQAQQPFVVDLARKQAVAAVFANTRALLNATGHRDLSLTVTF